MRLDVHTHAFHPKIADKAVSQLDEHYGIPPVGNGTVQDLLARVHRAGLDGAVVHTAATAPDQVVPANNWAIGLSRTHPDVVAFGTLHPGYADNEREVDRLLAAGIKGLKFHPDFQGFFLNDPAFYRVMELIGDRFVLMFHVGDTLPPEQNPSCPIKLAALHRNFPKAQIIAAHMGGFKHWPWALEYLAGTDVFLDTSSTLFSISDDLLKSIWCKHPRERILFGSDYPLFDPGSEMRILQQRLSLSDSDVDDLLAHAEALLS